MNSWVWDTEGFECHAKWLGVNPINIGVCVCVCVCVCVHGVF